jgi:hypothetical protein
MSQPAYANEWAGAGGIITASALQSSMRELEKRSGLMFDHYFIAGSAVTDFCEAAL